MNADTETIAIVGVLEWLNKVGGEEGKKKKKISVTGSKHKGASVEIAQ